jgi:SAM-dependent methyltransferase
MTNDAILSEELQRQYARRFTPLQEYRRRIWGVLTHDFFQKIIGANKTVLDLGCGWGEFINQIKAAKKYGMDLNPSSPAYLDSSVQFLEQDCSDAWQIPPASLDVIFTSNFFEHLPDKEALKKTLHEARLALRAGGKMICLGPNIKFVPGAYWDFLDHHLPLTELSLKEALELTGFQVERCEDRFLPYTMVGGPSPPMWQVRLYLKFPLAWKLKGKQFLVIATKPRDASLNG